MEEYIDNEPTDNTKEPKNPLSGKSTKYPMERGVSVLESYESFLHKFNIHKQEVFSEDEIEYANYKTLYDEDLRNQADLTDLPSPETVEILKNKRLDVTELYKK